LTLSIQCEDIAVAQFDSQHNERLWKKSSQNFDAFRPVFSKKELIQVQRTIQSFSNLSLTEIAQTSDRFPAASFFDFSPGLLQKQPGMASHSRTFGLTVSA